MIAHLRAGAAAAAVAQQGEIRAGLKAEFLVLHGEFAELDKMIAAAAGAELRRGLVAKRLRDGADGPVLVHDRMRAAMFEFRADAEARLGFDGADEIGFAAAQPVERQIEHGHFHAAGDVHAHGVRDDGVVGGQHAADGQAVADVGVGHERGGDGDGQLAGVLHLLERVGVQVRAPLAVGDGLAGHEKHYASQGACANGK